MHTKMFKSTLQHSKQLIFQKHFIRHINCNTIRFQRQVTNTEIEKYNFNSDRDVIPLYQYFLKFSCFNIQLPSIECNENNNKKDFFPLQDLKCNWLYTDNYKSLFGSTNKNQTQTKKLSMSEYEFMTARLLVKYLRNFPFIFTETETQNEFVDIDLFDSDRHREDKYRNVDKIVDFDEIYYKMFEEKCDLQHIDANNINISVPLSKDVIEGLIRRFKVNINGHSIDRSRFFLKENDEIIFDIPRNDLTENCQRRLLEYLFKLYEIYNRKNETIEQFLNSSQFKTVIKKTKKLTKYPSQSMELMQKFCIQSFNDNILHGIRHCIMPNHCDYALGDRHKIIMFEDNDIIVCNKPSGMAVHFAKNSQKYHSNSLVNFLLFYCGDLRKNIQKDSNLLKSSKLQNYNILPAVINELQLTISPGIIHRIDRQTSGLLIVAKTIFSMSNLLKQWRFHENIEREYFALVHGAFDGNALRLKYENIDKNLHENEVGEDDIYSADATYSTFYEDEEFEELYGAYYSKIKLKNDRTDFQTDFGDSDYYKCECWIGPKIINRYLPLKCYDEKEYKKKVSLMNEKENNKKINPFKISCSHFYKLKEYNLNGHVFTLLKCKLITVRTHQIRLHLQYLGMSVVGDRIYPRTECDSNGRQYRPKVDDSNSDNFIQTDLQIEKKIFNDGECENIDWFNGDCHALHAHTLKFQHPTTEETLDFKVDLPPFFQGMLKTLQKLT